MPRLLPDNPNLEYLKREAKDLLASLRETDPDATLSAAQAVLADQYGFRTWPDLKAEVDRRRAEVPVGDPALATALADAYGLGGVRSISPVSFSLMGRSWRLDTDRGAVLAHPVFDYFTEAASARSIDLMDRARAAGVATPIAVRTPAGALLAEIDGTKWRVDEWLETGPAPVQPVRADHARKAGTVVGTVHRIAPPTDDELHWHLAHRHPDDAWDALFERARAANMPWLDDFIRIVPTINELRAVHGDEPPGGRRVCQSDLNLEAVRLGPDGELVVVHWDFAGPHVPEWEIGSVALQWVVPTTNPAVARAFAEGYAAGFGSFPTLQLTSFTVAVSQWLNWFHARMCEAIDPSDAELGTYSEGEVRRELADPLTVAKLERVLEAWATASR